MSGDPLAQVLWERLSERWQAFCRELARVAEERGETVYLVGGAVRDLLLGASRVDLDIVVEGEAIGVAGAAAERVGGTAGPPSEFLTTAIDLPTGEHIDVATARQESYPAPTKLPTVHPAGITEDLRRRDFSVNAMALRLGAQGAVGLVDPCGGLRDLEAGTIRALHARSFTDDPTRVIRAVRFEQRLGFVLEAATQAELVRAVAEGMVERTSGSRIRDELVKLFGEPGLDRLLRRLASLDVLHRAIPGAAMDAESYRWVVAAPRALAALGSETRGSRSWPYLLGVVCAKGDGALAADRLQLDGEAACAVREMGRAARGPLPCPLTARCRPSGSRLAAALEDRTAAQRVVFWLRGGGGVRERLEWYGNTIRDATPDVTGDDLQEAGVPAGPGIGVGLRAARRETVDRGGTREEQLVAALEAVRRWRRPARRQRHRPGNAL